MAACLPVIALVELATGGALTSAISGVLGSQILGGAVLGLISSGGKPEGALFGALGGALSGAFSDAAGAAGAEAATSTTGELAADTLGNTGVGMSARDMEVAITGSQPESWVDSVQGISGGGDAATGSAGSKAAAVIRDGAKEGGKQAAKGGIMSRIEGLVTEHPTIAKIGLGAIKGIGEAKQQEDLLEKKYQLHDDLERKAQDRAFRGVDTSLPFRPASAGYQSPLQKYLGSMEK